MSESKTKLAVVDTGILIQYFSLDLQDDKDKNHKEYFDRNLFKNPAYNALIVSFLTRTELLYVQCREKGWDLAKSLTDAYLEHFLESRAKELDEIAPQLKCKLAISLVDCFNLAIGKLYQIPVYFMDENELTSEKITKIREDLGIDLRIMRKDFD